MTPTPTGPSTGPSSRAAAVRAAVDADADSIAAVEQECFGADAWSLAAVGQELLRDDRVVLVDVSVPDLAGYVDVAVRADLADLHRIAVRPALRRAGVAQRLLADALALAADRGADRVLLEVAADNAGAVALYDRNGFAPISRRRDYYGRGRDAVVMERTLP